METRARAGLSNELHCALWPSTSTWYALLRLKSPTSAQRSLVRGCHQHLTLGRWSQSSPRPLSFLMACLSNSSCSPSRWHSLATRQAPRTLFEGMLAHTCVRSDPAMAAVLFVLSHLGGAFRPSGHSAALACSPGAFLIWRWRAVP